MESTKKRTSRKAKPDVYQIVTDRIVKMLDEGTIPWRKTWKGGVEAPRNLLTNKAYRGVNIWLLACSGFTSPFWMTYKQAKQLGGTVKKGEKATPIVFWKIIDKEDKDGGKKKIFFLRYYNVFNLDQTEDVKVPKGRIQPETFGEGHLEFEDNRKPIEEADTVFNDYIEREHIKVNHGGGQACYSPLRDAISMPEQSTFASAEAFQATRFHEAGHSTGHEKRLKREGITEAIAHGSHRYANEELVAEFASSYLCSMVGIQNDAEITNAAAYIAHWRKKLTDDPKIIVQAAQQAQKASDMVLGVSFEEKVKTAEKATAA